MSHMIKSNHMNDFMNNRDANHINYNEAHQTNGYTNKPNNNTGRYTIVSKSITVRNGTGKGSYHPASHYFQLDTTKRSHSQQSIGTNASNGSMNSYSGTNNSSKNSINDINQILSPSNEKLNGIHSYPIKYSDIQHSKSHSVSSTLLLRDANTLKPTGIYREHSRSVGGSLSCGQPSPTSTVEDSNTTAFSPTSAHTIDTEGTNRTIWLYQSELNLPTNTEDTSFNTVITPYKRSKSQQITILPEFDNRNRDQTLNDISYNPHFAKYNSVSSTMLYTGNNNSMNQRNNINEDYMNNYASGPSFRKIQNLHGGNATQKRFPSDTTLNSTARDGAQIYTSGSRPGPVTIPARSRSAQPSPGPSPTISPVTCFRASENNLVQGTGGGEKNSYVAKSQKINLNVINTQRRGSSPSRVEHNNLNSFSSNVPEEDNESHILPSVREIIRQVEAMTQSNAATSTTDIFTLGLNNGTAVNHSNGQKENDQQSQLLKQRKINTSNDSQFARSGILRQGGSSQRTPSAPQLRTANYGNSQKYTPIQAKFNAAVSSNPQKTTAPPVPPHGIARNKPIIGSFTKRIESSTNDSNVTHKQTDYGNITSTPKKSELLSHLPTDYQKLREAFIEQRREIQRLRKQLAEKDLLISQLEGDIRLYEPWR
ncbi:hypothetical protein MN116_002928 [Schistosoma mekongi]|uniref:Uncharacterized protein n=1 Tax=Schistosoma mekongi TaxID=38744 RepID=A0AAE1ZHX2_SCHME|nr:hypothetical protein MN116_002928 [Schistosoma mekongi]